MSNVHILHENLREHLHNKGFKQLTPIQEVAIPAILKKNNVLLIAGTSGGKTEAALLPVLTMLADDESTSLKAIYIAPLKARLITWKRVSRNMPIAFIRVLLNGTVMSHALRN
jgi:ATP-dependent helicase Lhr and Lhr-like helicase